MRTNPNGQHFTGKLVHRWGQQPDQLPKRWWVMLFWFGFVAFLVAFYFFGWLLIETLWGW